MINYSCFLINMAQRQGVECEGNMVYFSFNDVVSYLITSYLALEQERSEVFGICPKKSVRGPHAGLSQGWCSQCCCMSWRCGGSSELGQSL